MFNIANLLYECEEGVLRHLFPRREISSPHEVMTQISALLIRYSVL